ncbi:hypothetical protein PENTCL1PPCAC_15548, partial [Pristionchus entomophagus]
MTVYEKGEIADERDCYLAVELKEIEQMNEEAAKKQYKWEIIWEKVALQIAIHLGALYGLYLTLTVANPKTFIWGFLVSIWAGNSITAGAHRLWTHKSYKVSYDWRHAAGVARYCVFEGDVIDWSRDHRTHHKWSDSDADPHNINRGFFFSHMGWLMLRKHPKVKEMGSKVDMSDLYADPILRFQQKYYGRLVMLTILILTAVPHYYWGETIWNSFFIAAVLRLVVQLHGTWAINSFAHTVGWKPFDTKITAVDSFFVSLFTNGEAWHNYHHTFPQDYRTSEYMWKANTSAMMIDFFAYMGWVWDRKSMSKEAIERQKMHKGDHSRHLTAA